MPVTPLEEALRALDERPESIPPRSRPGLSRPPKQPFVVIVGKPEQVEDEQVEEQVTEDTDSLEEEPEEALAVREEWLEDAWFSDSLVPPAPSSLVPPPPEEEQAEESGMHQRRDFRGANLVGADFRGRDLTGCDFSDADLTDADFTDARLVDAVLRGAVLHGAVLHGAELARADLTEVVLDHAVMSQAGFGDATLRGASCFEADVSHASFVGADLGGVDFRRCKGEGARFRRADLSNTDFSGADLSHADLVQTKVGGARFQAVDFRRARMRHLEGFEKASFIEADIRDVDFSHAYLLRRFIMDQNYLAELRDRSRYHAMLYWIWWATSDCGRSLARLGLWIAVVTVSFGAAYQQVAIDYGSDPTWLSPYYFSLVTLTTLGYGDVLPASVSGQAIVMAEVVVGYMLLGGMISIFANKMARRAE